MDKTLLHRFEFIIQQSGLPIQAVEGVGDIAEYTLSVVDCELNRRDAGGNAIIG